MAYSVGCNCTWRQHTTTVIGLFSTVIPPVQEIPGGRMLKLWGSVHEMEKIPPQKNLNIAKPLRLGLLYFHSICILTCRKCPPC